MNRQHIQTSKGIRISKDSSVNAGLMLEQNFEAREPEIQIFAALRAAFYKKRTEKLW